MSTAINVGQPPHRTNNVLSQSAVIGPYRRVVLLGGGQLLRSLCDWAPLNGYTIRVVTSPRHVEEVQDSESLHSFLESRNLPFLVTETIETDRVRDFIGESEGTFFLSLGAAWIFKSETIREFFNDKLFNLHGTRLPQNRGGGGFSWQIMTANRFGFCTLHVVDGGIDTGEIILLEEFLYPASCRIPQDYKKVYLEKSFVFLSSLLSETLDKTKIVKLITQPEYFSSYWPRLHTPTNAWIDWGLEPYELDRFICAFDTPYVGAQTYMNDQVVHLKNVSLNLQDGVFHSYQSGIIYRKSADWICVCIKGAALIIEKVLDTEGNSVLEKLNIGDRFFTPSLQLEMSKQRVVYKPTGLKLPNFQTNRTAT